MTENSDAFAFEIERMGVILVKRDEDIKVSVMVKLTGEKYAYETSYKVDASLLDPEKPTLEEFFSTARQAMEDVLRGKKELNAIV